MGATLIEQKAPSARRYRAVLIAGPTASGKSALAIELARRWNGTVINADSMQLYRELTIVTARPSAGEEAMAPHRLYGVLPSSEAFSTGAWLRMMAGELERTWGEGRLPILTGGTGLYFKALTEGFAELPEIDPKVRESCRTLAAEGGLEAVRAALAPLDEAAAEGLQDLQRLTRALEVVRSTGRTLADWQAEAQGAPLLKAEDCLRLVLAPPRAWLHERIARRAALMLQREGIHEVENLLALGLPDTLPAMRAIGVKEVAELLAGSIDAKEAERRLTVATRQYAKRQETWFRNQMGGWMRLDPSGFSASALADMLG
ncbi:tRNA (adenosine(37)-N6)-dimethylallyltransferase MiaA [Labrenzia suaedae]|uniref:tRNA dimethylallyltransferase n=2 Tax=Roseibium litorale TaxID=2803841 RepID=A0ABR9CJP2_9HYPH|nr:tRNA (adenosine(37)-N6)-dimethylallyltransferase MiaA [Roseibium litorale]